MRILLLGKNGQLGQELQRVFSPSCEVIALSRDTDQNGFCGDLQNLAALQKTIQKIAPQMILNAAAYTAVDKAETDTALNMQINAKAPAMLAQEAEQLGAWLIHYSSDYVFDGKNADAWQETDLPNPLNEYGKSKLAGEIAVAKAPKHLILRSSWVFSAHGNNFLKTMLRLGAERRDLCVVNDQFGAPTSAYLLAKATWHAWQKLQKNPEKSGLYHLCAAGETNWRDYAVLVLQTAQQFGFPLQITPEKIVGISSENYKTAAKRPTNSRLNCAKFMRSFDFQLPNWQVDVEKTVFDILQTEKREVSSAF